VARRAPRRFFFLATWALGGVAIRHYGKKDPQKVVSDEVMGYLVSVAFTLETTGGGAFWARALAGFILFRLFDIWKPGPVRMLERLPGGLGIAADDLLAGIFANGVIVLGYALKAHFAARI
jgi:phosphatidylglycerophosphatase A